MLDLLWLDRETLSVAADDGVHSPTWEVEPNGVLLTLVCRVEGCPWRGTSIAWDTALAHQHSTDEDALRDALLPGVHLFREWHRTARNGS